MMPSFLQKWLMPRLPEFYSANPHTDLRINVDNALVNFDLSDMNAALRLGNGHWAGLKSVKLMDDWIVPVCSRRLLKKTGLIHSMAELQKHDLLFAPSKVWDPWFRAFGESSRSKRWSLLNDSISILMAAEQGEGIALTRWSLASREIEARRLLRPIDTVVKTDWSHYFVAPPQFFDLPKVAAFRDWLVDHCRRFKPPD